MERVGERIERPWGAWTLLEMGSGYKVKRLEVLPGKRLSLQKHSSRSEHWVVVQGTARVTNDDRVFLLEMNESTFIPLGAVHRLENPNSTPLLVIEVLRGPLAGVRGILVRKAERARLVVASHVIQQAASVALEAADVQSVR